MITPSEAWGSNCTWWMCMFAFAKPLNMLASVSSLVSVMATQSPTLARIAKGCASFVPLSTACLSWARTKSAPSGSVAPAAVTWIGRWMTTTL